MLLNSTILDHGGELHVGDHLGPHYRIN